MREKLGEIVHVLPEQSGETQVDAQRRARLRGQHFARHVRQIQHARLVKLGVIFPHLVIPTRDVMIRRADARIRRRQRLQRFFIALRHRAFGVL